VLQRRGGAGHDTTTALDISNALAAGDEDVDRSTNVLVRRLHVGSRTIGALSVGLSRALTPDERVAYDTIADLLAPAISHVEHSRHLAVEVESRNARDRGTAALHRADSSTRCRSVCM
jgi:hypothetical protein